MPTPAEEDAFLEPILARYTDDGPRLIFADFLDESDDPADAARGELIRIQCALARLPTDDPRRARPGRPGSRTASGIPVGLGRPLAGLAVGWEFRRGLLDAVSVDAPTFLSRGRRTVPPGADPPGPHPRRGPAPRPAGATARSWPSVRELDLCGNDLGNGGVNLLLRSPYLARGRVPRPELQRSVRRRRAAAGAVGRASPVCGNWP